MFAPGLLSMIVSLALSSASSIEQQAVDAASSALQSAPAAVAPAVRPTARRVMTWVPSYGTTASMNQLTTMHGNVGPANSITHLALQFWVPTPDGKGVQYSTDGTVNDGVVNSFVQWGHSHGVKVVLAVYNDVPHSSNPPGNYSWDWDYAKNAFGANRVAFAAALVAEVKRLDMDGVDIDFEGPDQSTTGEHNGDRPAYVAFLKALKNKLGNKQLSLDSFPYIYNAPNWTWWHSILPVVDGMTSMGYQDIGRNAANWASYRKQKAHAGDFPQKLQLGMPSNLDTWQGNNAKQQTGWVVTDDAVGVGIWDAQFAGSSWQTAPVWRNLRKLRLGQ